MPRSLSSVAAVVLKGEASTSSADVAAMGVAMVEGRMADRARRAEDSCILVVGWVKNGVDFQ